MKGPKGNRFARWSCGGVSYVVSPMEPDPKLIGQLICAAVRDHPLARKMLNDMPELLEAHDSLGETALHFLAIEGYLEGVRFLIEAGANVNTTNKFGTAVLIEVAGLGEAAMVALLLLHGADPNAQSVTNDNAVHAGARSGSPETLDALLTAGARADYVTDCQETVWDAVAYRGVNREQLEAVVEKYGVRRPSGG